MTALHYMCFYLFKNRECHCFIAKVHHQNAKNSNAQHVKFQVYFFSQIGRAGLKAVENSLMGSWPHQYVCSVQML